MLSTYEIVIRKPRGEIVCSGNCYSHFTLLEYTLSQNQVGSLTLEYPRLFCDEAIGRNYRIEVWRRVGNAPAYLEGETCFFARLVEKSKTLVHIEAVSALHLIASPKRLIAYREGTPQSLAAAAPLDNTLKRIVRENTGVTATGSYNIAAPDGVRSYAPYLTVEADEGQWHSVAQEDLSHKYIFDVATEFGNLSKENNIEAFFDIVQTNHAGQSPFLEFRTWRDQRGTDRTWDSGNPVILDVEAGDIADYVRRLDWTDSATRVYAGGNGSGATRIIGYANDPALATSYADDPFALDEVFLDDSASDTQAKAAATAQAELGKRGALDLISGTLTQTSCRRYGVDFFFGDKVSVATEDGYKDVFISPVSVSVKDHIETVSVEVNSESHVGLTGSGRVVKALGEALRRLRYFEAREA